MGDPLILDFIQFLSGGLFGLGLGWYVVRRKLRQTEQDLMDSLEDMAEQAGDNNE